MSKKKGVAWSFIIEFTVGAIILGLILIYFFPNLFPYPHKLWNLSKTKIKEEFTPYQDELTKEETKVDNSVGSIRCAINSIAIGERGFSSKGANSKVCPEAIPFKEEEKDKATAKVISFIGNAVGETTEENKKDEIKLCEGEARYGGSCISCKGSGSRTIVLGIDKEKLNSNKAFISSQVAGAVYNCFKKVKKDSELEYVRGEEFFNCYILDARQVGDIEITEKGVIDQLKSNAKYDPEYVKDLTGGSRFDLGLLNKDQLSFQTIKRRSKPYCVYYDLDTSSHDIVVGNCRHDLIDAMVCEIKDFNMPQEVGTTTAFIPKNIIGAYGKPRWLVYYESFPQEKTSYWKKSFWGNLLSWDSLINVGLGATLNFVFARPVAAKAGKKIAEKAAVAGAKEAQEKLTKEMIETGGGYLAKRFATKGVPNGLRSLFIEESLQKIAGLSDDATREITERILDVAGKKGGKKTFENVLEKRLTSELDEVIEAGIKKGTITLEQQSKEELVQKIMKGMEMEMGDGEVVKGLKGVFGKRMTKEAVKKIITSESYDAFFRKFLVEGTEGINKKALTETAENSLKYLDDVAKLEGDGAVEKILQKSLAQLDDLIKGAPGEKVRAATKVIEESGGNIPKELFRGSVGMSWDDFTKAFAKGKLKGSWHVFKELQPVRQANVRWFNPVTLGPVGKTVATVGKTTIHLPAWVAKHRYPVLLLLIVANELEREQNRELIPIGTNKLGVTVPYLFGTDAKTYDLHPDVEKYFVTNRDRQEQRLYLVSPCVTDFQVVKKTCSCVSNPLRWRWNFGGGLMDVQKGTIKPEPDSVIREEAEKEAKSGKYKLYDAWKEAATIYYELKEKGVSIDKLPSLSEIDPKKGTLISDVEDGLNAEPGKAGLYDAWKEAVPIYDELKEKGIDVSKLPSPFDLHHKRAILTNNVDWDKFLNEFPEWGKGERTKLPNTGIYYLNLYEVIDFKEKTLSWNEFQKEFPEWDKGERTKLPNTGIYYENLHEVIEFNNRMYQEGRTISKEELALEMWVTFIEESAADFFEFQTKPYSGMGDVEIGWFRSKSEEINRDARYFIRYSPYIDTSDAVKVCDSRGVMEQSMSLALSLFKDDKIENNPYMYPQYKIDCIEFIPNVKEGYCYDYFKTQEQLKIGVIVAAATVDIVISVATAGTAAPIVFLATGAATGAIESIIGSTEVWPLRTEGFS